MSLPSLAKLSISRPAKRTATFGGKGVAQNENVDVSKIDKEDSCAICMGEFEDGDDAVRACGTKEKGGHIFHRACIKEWAKKRAKCAMCSENLDFDPYEEKRKKYFEVEGMLGDSIKYYWQIPGQEPFMYKHTVAMWDQEFTFEPHPVTGARMPKKLRTGDKTIYYEWSDRRNDNVIAREEVKDEEGNVGHIDYFVDGTLEHRDKVVDWTPDLGLEDNFGRLLRRDILRPRSRWAREQYGGFSVSRAYYAFEGWGGGGELGTGLVRMEIPTHVVFFDDGIGGGITRAINKETGATLTHAEFEQEHAAYEQAEEEREQRLREERDAEQRRQLRWRLFERSWRRYDEPEELRWQIQGEG